MAFAKWFCLTGRNKSAPLVLGFFTSLIPSKHSCCLFTSCSSWKTFPRAFLCAGTSVWQEDITCRLFKYLPCKAARPTTARYWVHLNLQFPWIRDVQLNAPFIPSTLCFSLISNRMVLHVMQQLNRGYHRTHWVLLDNLQYYKKEGALHVVYL